LTKDGSILESQIKDNLIEYLNTEICNGTVISLMSALSWLKNTFYYVRMKAKPEVIILKLNFSCIMLKEITKGK